MVTARFVFFGLFSNYDLFCLAIFVIVHSLRENPKTAHVKNTLYSSSIQRLAKNIKSFSAVEKLVLYIVTICALTYKMFSLSVLKIKQRISTTMSYNSAILQGNSTA